MLIVSAVVVGACGLSAIGQLDAADGGAPSPIDGSRAVDGALGDSGEPPLVVDAAGADAFADASGDASADAGNDAATITPACIAGKVSCGGACVTGTDCTSCAGAEYLCAPTRRCVAGCTTCTDLAATAMPVECFACDTNQNNPLGTCAHNSAAGFCLNANYSTAFNSGAGMHCDCNNTNVANCPGGNQVCKPNGGTDWCITCGESGLSTNGLPCKGGGTCNAGLSPPRCL